MMVLAHLWILILSWPTFQLLVVVQPVLPLNFFYGDDTTQDADEDYLQIALTANWESDGNSILKLNYLQIVQCHSNLFMIEEALFSLSRHRYQFKLKTSLLLTKDGPNRPATLKFKIIQVSLTPSQLR